jgi:hypothetical protein
MKRASFTCLIIIVTTASPALSSNFVRFSLAPTEGGGCPWGHFLALTDDGEVIKGTVRDSGCGPYIPCGVLPTTDEAVDLFLEGGIVHVLTVGGEIWSAPLEQWETPCGQWTLAFTIPAAAPFVGLATSYAGGLYALTVTGEVWTPHLGQWIVCYSLGGITSVPEPASPIPSTWGQIKAGR